MFQSLGNHEFDNGVSGLTPFIENLTCPVLAANLVLNKEPALQAETNLRNSVIFQINNTKVGVIGYLTPETKVLAIGNNVEYIDETIAIRKEIVELKKQNVSIFIALGHSGFAKDLEIARDVEDIDLVIGGHTNTFLWNGTSPDTEKPTGPYPRIVNQTSGRLVPVVQAYAYTKYLGKLHLVFNSAGELVSYDGNPILLDKTIPQDPEVLLIINKYRDSVLKVSEVPVGNTSVVLDANPCRYKECNLGNMITDAMVFRYASEYVGDGWTDSPIAIIQRGGIRASISHIHLPAQVTYGDLLNVLPFDGSMMRVSINGSDVVRMLEHAVERYNPQRAPGEFLHMSGIKVIYDFKKRPGSRVTKVSVLCGKCKIPEYFPLNKTKEYMILMSSFIQMGGDGYALFKTLPAVKLEYNELDSLTDYVQKHSPIYPAVEDRITMLHIDKIRNSAGFLTVSPLVVIIFLVTFISK